MEIDIDNGNLFPFSLSLKPFDFLLFFHEKVYQNEKFNINFMNFSKKAQISTIKIPSHA